MPKKVVLPEVALAAVKRFCEEQVPADLRDQIRVECEIRGRSVTILEARPPWKEELGPEWTKLRVAQLRYDSDSGRWALHWPDRNGRWHPYDEVPATPDVQELLAEIDRDPTNIFWG